MQFWSPLAEIIHVQSNWERWKFELFWDGKYKFSLSPIQTCISSSICTDLQTVSQSWGCSKSNRKQQSATAKVLFFTFSQNRIQTLLLGFCSKFITCCEFCAFFFKSLISIILHLITFLGKKKIHWIQSTSVLLGLFDPNVCCWANKSQWRAAEQS